jgi:hypothetical protein
MSDWLDLELSHQLRPAEAPPELWVRVERAAALPPPRRNLRPFPIAAIVTLALAAGTLWFAARGAQPVKHVASTDRSGSTCMLCHTTL